MNGSFANDLVFSVSIFVDVVRGLFVNLEIPLLCDWLFLESVQIVNISQIILDFDYRMYSFTLTGFIKLK